jgi:hypothetical protein
MGFLWAMSLPGLVVALFVLAAIERFTGRLPWRRRRPPASAVGLDEMTALFYATKHHELQQRHTELMLRDDAEDGAGGPPRLRFELDRPS